MNTVRKSIDGRYKEEHRIIMEEYLGRPLTKDEVIHHINGNHFDNRLENLMITTAKEHAKMYHPNRYKSIRNERTNEIPENARIRKMVSLDDKIIEKGEKMAERLSMNFSSYLSYLINVDCGTIQPY